MSARDELTAAARAGDCATLRKMISDRDEFGKQLRGADSHPLLVASTPEAAMLLLPFAGQRVLLKAIRDALYFAPVRPEVAKTLIEQGRSRLGRAIYDGHIWLNQWRGGTSALHLAAEVGCDEVLPSLLALRPNLEAHGRYGTSALGLAVQNCHIGMVKMLLAAGADPDPGIRWIRDNEQSKAIAQLLIDAGARTTSSAGRLLAWLPRDRWQRVIAQAAPAGAWPHEQVTIAFEVTDSQFAGRLIKAGADSTASTVGALRNVHSDVLPLVVPSLNTLSPGALPHLVLKPDVLQAALAEGLDVNARDEAGYILLTNAATRLGNATMRERRRLRHSIEILLNAGADRSGRIGRSSPLRAFLDVAPERRSNSLRWLLLRGLRDPLVLHHYLRPGMYPSPNLLRILLQFGFSPNHRDIHGRTPLHLLAANNVAHAWRHLELLLDAGADATLKDNEDQAPLDIALRSKQSDVIVGLQADRRRREASAMRASLVHSQITGKPPAMRL
jgi:ankyrin repeat protein